MSHDASEQIKSYASNFPTCIFYFSGHFFLPLGPLEEKALKGYGTSEPHTTKVRTGRKYVRLVSQCSEIFFTHPVLLENSKKSSFFHFFLYLLNIHIAVLTLGP